MILYKDYKISKTGHPFKGRYEFWHDDTDSFDHLSGHGDTVDDCMDQIDEMEQEINN